MIGVCELSDKLKVFQAVDVSVSHELQVLLIHTTLDQWRHWVYKHAPSLSLLNQSLRGEERGGEKRRGGGRGSKEVSEREQGRERKVVVTFLARQQHA